MGREHSVRMHPCCMGCSPANQRSCGMSFSEQGQILSSTSGRPYSKTQGLYGRTSWVRLWSKRLSLAGSAHVNVQHDDRRLTEHFFLMTTALPRIHTALG